jgi:hypothetical protein
MCDTICCCLFNPCINFEFWRFYVRFLVQKLISRVECVKKKKDELVLNFPLSTTRIQIKG